MKIAVFGLGYVGTVSAATASSTAAVRQSEVSLVCVGTPSRDNGHLDLTHLLRVTRQIGEALRGEGSCHVVAFRSTMLPGTVENHFLSKLEGASGRKAGDGFGIAVNPEFEGVAERLCDEQILIDLVGLAQRGGDRNDYRGIRW